MAGNGSNGARESFPYELLLLGGKDPGTTYKEGLRKMSALWIFVDEEDPRKLSGLKEWFARHVNDPRWVPPSYPTSKTRVPALN